MLKTYANWKGDLSNYLNWGDEVDEAMMDYVIGCLPPRTMNGNMVQMGEPYSDKLIDGKYYPTYLTFISNGLFIPNRKWYYAGAAIAGDKEVQRITLEFIQ